MSKTLVEGNCDGNCDGEDGVVANEVVVGEAVVPSGDGVEVIVKSEKGGEGIEENGDVVKDTGPPDGGYGWVVVAYDVICEMLTDSDSAVGVLNAFTWGVNAVSHRFRKLF